MKEEKVLYNAVVCFPVQNGGIWLGRKVKKIGAGLWNGWGGGIEEGETPVEATCRELFEEAGVKVKSKDLIKVAEVIFNNTKSDGQNFELRIHVYFAQDWIGEIAPSDEMAEPTLFPLDSVPYDQMMPADRDWLPPVLEGKKVKAEAWYGPFQESLLKETVINIVENFD